MQTYSVFVYGTLRKGGTNHDFLQGSVLLQEHYLLTGYRLYDSLHQYPYMLKGSAGDSVVGEVYQISEKLLQQLHILEDIGVEYRFEYLQEHKFYSYLKQYPGVGGLPVVPDGDWIRYI